MYVMNLPIYYKNMEQDIVDQTKIAEVYVCCKCKEILGDSFTLVSKYPPKSVDSIVIECMNNF